jgi:hypothetical protein
MLSNAVVPGVGFCHDLATTTGTVNAVGTANSAVVTVARTANLKVGMIPMIGNISYTYETSDAATIFAANGINAGTTRDIFGVGNKIKTIDSATQITMEKPLVANLSQIGKNQFGATNAVIFYPNAETFCAHMGQQANSITVNPLTGVTRGGENKAVAFPNSFPVVPSSVTDPVRSCTAARVVAPNGWLFSVTDAQAAGGEQFTNATWKMNIPSYVDAAYINNRNNADQNICIRTADGRYDVEMFKAVFNPTTLAISCTRAVVTDANGPSIPYILDRPEFLNFNNSFDGISYGTRAWGGGLIGGIVRYEEWLDIPDSSTTGESPATISAKIDQAMNAIPHGLAMVYGGAQLKSYDYCPDPAVPGVRINYKSYISQFEKHTPSIQNGGSGYAVGNILYATPGTFEVPARFEVATIGANGAVTSVLVASVGQYRVPPDDGANITTTTNGAGTGCILNVISLAGDPTITTVAQAFPDSGRNSIWTYPGTSVDNSYTTNYSGCTPMSGTYSTDPRFTVASLKAEFTWRRTQAPTAKISSYEYLAVLAALCKYGAMVVDLSANTHNLVVVDDRVSLSANYSNLHGDAPNAFTYPNLQDLKTRSAFVENVTVLGKGAGTTPKAGSAFVADLYPINN